MPRDAWERARVRRFNELLQEVKDGTKDRDKVHAILDQELPESLIDAEASPVPPPSSKRGRPRKQCGHPEFERKPLRNGYSYCGACKRDRARKKWQRTHKQQRRRVPA